MRKIESYTKKYGGEVGSVLLSALQGKSSYASLYAKAKTVIAALTGKVAWLEAENAALRARLAP